MAFNFIQFCLTLSVLGRLKNSVIEISIIPQTLDINNWRVSYVRVKCNVY